MLFYGKMSLFYVEEHGAWKVKVSKTGCLVLKKGRKAPFTGKMQVHISWKGLFIGLELSF